MPGTEVLVVPEVAGRDALDDPQVVGVVVVGAEDHLQHDADGGRDAAP